MSMSLKEATVLPDNPVSFYPSPTLHETQYKILISLLYSISLRQFSSFSSISTNKSPTFFFLARNHFNCREL
ncbi:hypothetical protein FRX31_032532 [Thalictrum thalictroides]|uniref:Uncharacterized protein n=1 Tax=Thalictrum thalictroides TaxID=46969 RepID=A0A7J6UZ12_THATH|nr:hypothetical protein FRX31_032532 [Thalictrum thalictroides]